MMELWAFVSGAWTFLLFLNLSSHSYVFFSCLLSFGVKFIL